MQLYQAAAVADRGLGPDDYKLVRLDTVVGTIVARWSRCAIIIATAAAIGGTGPLASAEDAAKALEPVVGSAAKALFGIGLLGASALAAAVVPLSTAYAHRRGRRRRALGVAQLPRGAGCSSACSPRRS